MYTLRSLQPRVKESTVEYVEKDVDLLLSETHKKIKINKIKSDCVSDPWRSHFSFYNESFTMLVGGEFMTRSRALELCFNEYCLFCAQRTWTRTWLTQYTFPVLASGYSAYRQQVVVTSGKKRSNVLSKGENVFEEGQETQFLDLKDTNNVFW